MVSFHSLDKFFFLNNIYLANLCYLDTELLFLT